MAVGCRGLLQVVTLLSAAPISAPTAIRLDEGGMATAEQAVRRAMQQAISAEEVDDASCGGGGAAALAEGAVSADVSNCGGVGAGGSSGGSGGGGRIGVSQTRMLVLRIESPAVPTLDIIDLPGLVSSRRAGEPADLPEQTRCAVIAIGDTLTRTRDDFPEQTATSDDSF